MNQAMAGRGTGDYLCLEARAGNGVKDWGGGGSGEPISLYLYSIQSAFDIYGGLSPNLNFSLEAIVAGGRGSFRDPSKIIPAEKEAILTGHPHPPPSSRQIHRPCRIVFPLGPIGGGNFGPLEFRTTPGPWRSPILNSNGLL